MEKEKKGEKGKTQKKQRKTFNTDCTNTEITQALRTKTLASPLQLQRRGKKRRKKERKTEARTEGRDEPFTETELREVYIENQIKKYGCGDPRIMTLTKQRQKLI